MDYNKEKVEELKGALRERKKELPEILSRTNSIYMLAVSIVNLPDEILENVPLHDAVQYLNVKFVELCGKEMVLPLLKINSEAMRRKGGFFRKESEEMKVLKAQDKMLSGLKKVLDSGDDVISPFVEIFDNLQAIYPQCSRKLLTIVISVAEKAIEETKSAIAGYENNDAI